MASYMSRQHEVGKKSYDFSTLDLFQPLDPYFGYPGDNGTETGLDNGSQDFASPSCPKTPQLANSAIRTDSPRDRSPANPCDLDLGIDLPSPTWLDDFLAEIDPARDWEPSRFTQSLDTGFSQCSGRRTGGSGSSIRNCSNNILERRSTISPLFSFRLDSLRGIGDWLVTSSVRNPDTEELNAELLNGKSLTQENQLLLSAPRPEIPFLVQAREDIQFIVTSIDHHFGVTNAIQAGSQPTSTWVDSSGFRGDSERIPTDDKAERLNLWLRELPRLFGHSGESEVALHEPRLVLLEPARLHIEAVLPEVSLETRTFVKDSNLPQKLAITKKQQLRPTRRSQKQQARQKLYGSTSGNSDCSSTTDSASTATSARSSSASHASWSGRKGRIRHEGNFSSLNPLTSNPNKPFRCTWCWKIFAKASDWKRHEESQHAPQTEWICMPNGPETVFRGQKICVLCRLVNPDDAHLYHHHRQATCLDETLVGRRFDRKDHLIQHILHSHGIATTSNQPVDLLNWQRPIQDIAGKLLWKCGFCDASSMTWQQRYSHVAEHMKSGHSGATWRRCLCTHAGIRPEIIGAATKRGFEAIYVSTCRRFWWCGSLERSSGMPCPRYFTTQDERQTHWNSEHAGMSYLPNEDGSLCLSVGLPEEACVQFWCGFCGETIEMTDRTPYDCSRMHHFSHMHSKPVHANRDWVAINQNQGEMFSSNAVGILLTKGLLHNYPVDLRPEIALQFASRLLEHQVTMVY